MPAPTPEPRGAFRYFLPLTTRWMDNDVYGHVNNVIYYSYFDTVVNQYLIEQGGLDFAAGSVIGLCVESHCQYLEPIAFPDPLEAGLRTGPIGRSSVRYEIGIFKREAPTAAAQGYFVHVFVDRATRRPVELPSALRAALDRLRNS